MCTTATYNHHNRDYNNYYGGRTSRKTDHKQQDFMYKLGQFQHNVRTKKVTFGYTAAGFNNHSEEEVNTTYIYTDVVKLMLWSKKTSSHILQ